MSEKMTAEKFARSIIDAYWILDCDAFVRVILKSEPRNGDVWQEEKFERFQQAAAGLARLSPEIIESIIDYMQKGDSNV